MGIHSFMDDTVPLEASFQDAWQLHINHHLPAAERAYLALLSARPSWPKVQSLLGALYLETGRFEQARSLLSAALEGGAEDLETRINYVGVLIYLGDLETAAVPLRVLHECAPDAIAVLELDAHYYFKRGDWARAQQVTQALLKRNPDHLMALQVLIQSLFQQEEAVEARRLLRAAVARFPDDLELGLHWGEVLLGQRHTRELGELHAHLLTLHPQDFRLRLQQAIQAKQAKDETRFCAVLDVLLQERPEDPRTKQIFVNYLIEQGRCGEALRELYTLSEGLPRHAWLSAYLLVLSHLQAYHAAYDQIQSFQDSPLYPGLFGTLSYYQGELATAVSALSQHIVDYPHDASTRLTLGMARFLLGEYNHAWDAYEARCAQTADLVDAAPVPGIPPWEGQPGSGQRVLVFCEQGLGDVIQFIRYLPALTTQQIKPVLLINAYEQLLPLLQPLLVETDQEAAESETVEAQNYDFQIPLLSLPKMLGLQQDGMAHLVPYLQAAPSHIEQWHAWLDTVGPGLKVGLVWAGNPKHLNDHRRSMDLSCFDALAVIPGIRWINLQVGSSREDAEYTGALIPLITPPTPIHTLADTAALIEGLDLVLTVDTSVAHLAGAMGRPVWVLLPFLPDWRWGMEGEASRWYPTMILFRQKQAGSWSEVIAQVADQLLHQVHLRDACTTASSEPNHSGNHSGLSQCTGSTKSGVSIQVHAHIAHHATPSCDVRSGDTEVSFKQNRSYRLSPLQRSLLKKDTSPDWSGVGSPDLVAACPLLLARQVQENDLILSGWAPAWVDEFRVWKAISNGEVVWPTLAWRDFSLACCDAAWKNTSSLSPVVRLDWLDCLQSHRTLPVSDFWRAQVLLTMNQYAKAHELVYPLGQKVPRHLPFRLLSFEAMDKLGAKAAALHFAQTAVHYAPRNPVAWVSFLQMLLRYRLAEPVRDFLCDVTPLIEKESAYPVIRAHLSMLLAEKEEARRWWEIVLHREPVSKKMELDRIEAALRLQYWDQVKHFCSQAEVAYADDQSFQFGHFHADMFSRGQVEDWAYYPARFLSAYGESWPFSCPIWQGQSLVNRRLLIYSEQGFGDHIYFSKCLVAIQVGTYDLAFENASLVRLLKYSRHTQLFSSQDFWDKKLDLSGYDYVVSIADLPRLLGFAPLTPPPGESYLSAPSERVGYWKQVLAEFQGLRVGLVWAGNPDYGRDEYRSMRLRDLACLANIQQVTFFSLQLGLAEREILFAPGGMKVLNVAADLNNFEESASLLLNLDLLITVDTSIAHLAGGLGVPVWMMVPHDCDFRWGISRLDCPWYPSMRIFRQPYQGCWAAVVNDVHDALNKRVYSP